LITESMLVAAGAGVLGFLVSVVLMRWASRMKMPYPIPISFDLNPDWRVLLFTLALTVFTGLAFGLAPALESTRTDLAPALKQGGNIQFRRMRRWSLRNALVLCQMAASLTLLLLTGYMGLGIQSSLAAGRLQPVESVPRLSRSHPRRIFGRAGFRILRKIARPCSAPARGDRRESHRYRSSGYGWQRRDDVFLGW